MSDRKQNIERMRALGVHPDNQSIRASADDVCAGMGLAMGHAAQQVPFTPSPGNAETVAAALRIAAPSLPRTMGGPVPPREKK